LRHAVLRRLVTFCVALRFGFSYLADSLTLFYLRSFLHYLVLPLAVTVAASLPAVSADNVLPRNAGAPAALLPAVPACLRFLCLPFLLRRLRRIPLLPGSTHCLGRIPRRSLCRLDSAFHAAFLLPPVFTACLPACRRYAPAVALPSPRYCHSPAAVPPPYHLCLPAWILRFPAAWVPHIYVPMVLITLPARRAPPPGSCAAVAQTRGARAPGTSDLDQRAVAAWFPLPAVSTRRFCLLRAVTLHAFNARRCARARACRCCRRCSAERAVWLRLPAFACGCVLTCHRSACRSGLTRLVWINAPALPRYLRCLCRAVALGAVPLRCRFLPPQVPQPLHLLPEFWVPGVGLVLFLHLGLRVLPRFLPACVAPPGYRVYCVTASWVPALFERATPPRTAPHTPAPLACRLLRVRLGGVAPVPASCVALPLPAVLV